MIRLPCDAEPARRLTVSGRPETVAIAIPIPDRSSRSCRLGIVHGQVREVGGEDVTAHAVFTVTRS